MAKESLNPSLTLPAVLAEEFAQLHGQPSPIDPASALPAADQLQAIWGAVHQLKEKQAALCISGGGIRSATFALGILQGLARCGLLEKFHYLSTVSGGGYIGGWLSAWIHHAERGLPEVVENLAQPRRETRPNPEPQQIRNLRSYSNYLSPRLGMLSADTWTLIGTYLRNLLLNWTVIIPLLAAVLTIPWLYVAVLMVNPPPYSRFSLGVGGVIFAISIAYMGKNLPCGGNAGWNQNRFLLFCLLPALIGSILLTIGWGWCRYYDRPLIAWRLFRVGPFLTSYPFIAFGIVMHVLSWLTSLFRAHGFKWKEFLAVVISGGAGGWLLWLGATKTFNQPVASAELYTCFAVPLVLSFYFLSIMVFAGISSRWTGDPDREWWGRATGWLLATAVSWTLLSGLVVFGPLLLSWSRSAFSTVTAGALSGAVTIWASRSRSIPANDTQTEKASTLGRVLAKATSLAAIVFIVVVLIMITQGTTWILKIIGSLRDLPWRLDDPSALLGRPIEYLNVLYYTPLWWLIVTVVGLLVFGLGMVHLINTNKFSLHAMYRDRLIRAYLGASNPSRNPNLFTGFDDADNLRLWNLWSPEKFRNKLLPVVNIALNLVGGTNLAWQERKATSFTMSPLHCGSYDVGYRKTTGPDRERYGGDTLSLGTAISISGAAASPNMGYHSSAFVTFILTLLNVRLGAWFGNPGPAGDKTYFLNYPNLSVRPIVAEAFGLTNETNPYVYLSDGGHFENLGLYEMVLRRCHYIVVSDAGQDPACSFADLGGAIRKIRIDLGISIEFDEIDIYSRDDELAQNVTGRHAAVGRIHYSQVDGPDAPDGVVVYIKPACYGTEPRDIYEYFKTNKTFPHESTADQFFTESQFESYRMLGVHTMDRLCEKGAGDFPDFIRGLLQNHLKTAPPSWLESVLKADTSS